MLNSHADWPSFPSRILVWDAQNSRYLLECTSAEFHPDMSYGSLFACSTTGSDIYIWKESLAGYMQHGILSFGTGHPTPLLTQNGEFIVAFGGCLVQLWCTKTLTAPPSGTPTRSPQHTEDFILEFSPNGMLAVVAMRKDNIVTVLSLKSGIPQLIVNAKMEVYGLEVIGNTVVIGDQKVITWNPPTGDCIPHTCVGLEDSSWTMYLANPPGDTLPCASIPPNSHHIALSGLESLYVYSASTGELLWKESTWGHAPRLPSDGYEVCVSDHDGQAEMWRVNKGHEVPEPPVDIEHPPEGYPWGSSRGYWVTEDWWIVGPDGRRLLLLPLPWQSYAVHRIWRGDFLALLHGGLSEPVILELELNCGRR